MSTVSRERLAHQWEEFEKMEKAVEFCLVKGWTSKDVAGKLGITRTSYFSLLKRAREAGIIKIHSLTPDFIDLTGSINLTLGREMMLGLRDYGLETATVLELPPQLSGEEEYNSELDKILHSYLARTATQELYGLIRQGDHLAVGPGDEIVELAKLSSKNPRDENCRITSLSSRFRGEDLDTSANLAALYLIYAFGGNGKGEYNQPNFMLGDSFSGWGDSPGALPNIAVVGINEHFIDAQWDNIKRVPIRIGIAGGLHKASRIFYAIEEGYINRIVIDAVTAESVVNLAK